MPKDSLEEKMQADEQTSSQNSDDPIEELPDTPNVAAMPIVGPGEAAAIAVEEQILEEAREAKPSERRELVKSASLVMLGNLSSSLIGFVRQAAVAASGPAISSSFFAALLPAQTFNDFLVNGSVSGALIPTFNDYAAPEKREELRRLVFTIINLVILIMLPAAIAFLFIAPFVTNVLATNFSPEDKVLTAQFAQIIFFSLLLLGPFAVLQAALYALKEFGWAAFAATSYHVGIIIGAIASALLGTYFFGHLGLAFGVILGAAGEIALLLPGIRRQKMGYMFILDLQHPALKRILRLYAPVALSFLVSMALIYFDQHLASSTQCVTAVSGVKNCAEANVTALRLATTLTQFPVGLVAAALAFAVLPTLTAHARENNPEQFKDTLLLGVRLGLLLMIPAAAGLIVLSGPIVALLFQHGKHTAQDAALTAIALRGYAYQLPFIAIDQLCINAFYARKNTIIPVVVGFVCILGYLAVALPFANTGIGMPALAVANTVQNSLHGIILLVLLRRAIGPMHIRKTVPVVLKILLATAAMVAVAWGLQLVLGHVALFTLSKFYGQLLTVVVVGGLAAGVYFGGVMLLKVEEIALLKGAALAKLGRK
ncbi:MAG TPA: lipid II flippase MurJ [Ktedonosporobacter sp.]|nr:lipid II flippase MurJ [Ktedonosporobacter sp.]